MVHAVVVVVATLMGLWALVQLFRPQDKPKNNKKPENQSFGLTPEELPERSINTEPGSPGPQEKDEETDMKRVVEYQFDAQDIIELLRKAGVHIPDNDGDITVYHKVEFHPDDCPKIVTSEPIAVSFIEKGRVDNSKFRDPSHASSAGPPQGAQGISGPIDPPQGAQGISGPIDPPEGAQGIIGPIDEPIQADPAPVPGIDEYTAPGHCDRNF